jgi:hypothetical protein
MSPAPLLVCGVEVRTGDELCWVRDEAAFQAYFGFVVIMDEVCEQIGIPVPENMNPPTSKRQAGCPVGRLCDHRLSDPDKFF